MLHYVLYHIFDKRHYLAEFKKDQFPKRVLDIGCGTGIWIHDVAKEWREQGHTDVQFYGVDLVPIQSQMVSPQTPLPQQPGDHRRRVLWAFADLCG